MFRKLYILSMSLVFCGFSFASGDGGCFGNYWIQNDRGKSEVFEAEACGPKDSFKLERRWKYVFEGQLATALQKKGIAYESDTSFLVHFHVQCPCSEDAKKIIVSLNGKPMVIEENALRTVATITYAANLTVSQGFHVELEARQPVDVKVENYDVYPILRP